MADLGGAFCFAEEKFVTLMKSEWPGASPHALPIELFNSLQRTPRLAIYGHAIVVAPFLTKTLIFLRARLREPIDSLTRREREIAELVVVGDFAFDGYLDDRPIGSGVTQDHGETPS
ncbi:hypothetical protein LMG28688_03752 [Paraburkholderia caffeinitolerans]|uniref:Uncharacterized protein n=1 Tax=Paraburkholderia caffeinitolerans TaxID=1723730 RepID=A0A6J5G586_9BURK|nr:MULTISPECIES: hypothetical protein [Paraburkholderia]CAB3793571.1 hypothetical protein LMG28688_03752 [Paraburkholderia caffeinitolerans]